MVVAHLGNGASMAAVLDGASIDTSMGLTPTGGLVMGTRAGDVDPGVLFHLLRDLGLPLEAVIQMTTVSGGLRGLSGTTADMRELLDRSATDPRATDAVDIFCYHIRKYIGAYVAALGGLDTLVFTGGIGENAAVIRERACRGLECFGIQLDSERNAAHAAVISPDCAAVTVRVMRTNEELMIARHVARVLASAESAEG
jgi:acetate kinase